MAALQKHCPRAPGQHCGLCELGGALGPPVSILEKADPTALLDAQLFKEGL